MSADTYTDHISSNVKELASLRQFVQDTCTKLGVDEDTVLDIMLAVNEAATNIILHGYRTQTGAIEIQIKQSDRQTIVTTLYDQAFPFDPTAAPAPDLTRPLELRPPGGMGIHMMRQLMDELQYTRTADGRNQLSLIKKIGA